MQYSFIFVFYSGFNRCSSSDHNPCNVNANCTDNLNGTDISCTCKTGFTGNGITCTGICRSL